MIWLLPLPAGSAAAVWGLGARRRQAGLCDLLIPAGGGGVQHDSSGSGLI